ncbi:hypothetical protein ACJJTC_002082, partial [Scirpophaga incertulas]
MDDVVAHVKETTGVDNNECDKKSCEGGGDDCDKEECEDKKQPVEIQITGGGSDVEESEQRQRTRRWLGQKQHSDPRDLLSNNPRVACVCGACAACPHCRGRRRRACPVKQDSGIACSVECGDCCETVNTGKSCLPHPPAIWECRCTDNL